MSAFACNTVLETDTNIYVFEIKMSQILTFFNMCIVSGMDLIHIKSVILTILNEFYKKILKRIQF